MADIDPSTPRPQAQRSEPRLTAIIVGAGMSGLLAAMRLKQEGIESFVILEKSGDVGGTWLDNHYPGASCDVPSHLYAYSFRPKADWSRMFAMQPEILDYFRTVADDARLRPHTAFNTEVTGAAFDESEGVWQVKARGGRSWMARFLIVATGQLNKPAIPEIPGRRDFAGVQFHSARWKENINIAGKRVVAVGTGASAAQYIPHLADEAGQLTIIQRSPNWIVPRKDFEFSSGWQRALRWLPPLRLGLRGYIYAGRETMFRALQNPDGFIAARLKKQARAHLELQVPDPVLRRKLTPDYPVGCKRVLVASDYYPALMRKNVDLLTESIARVHQTGIEMSNGRRISAEILIWGTGFDTESFVLPIEITGIGGMRLKDKWANGAYGYKGTLVSGFPNMAVLYGPNTNLGHNSVIFMAERQMSYVMQLIRRILSRDLRYADVQPEAETTWNEQLQQRLGRTVWAEDCDSWYKHDGRIVNNWSSSTMRFAWETRRLDDRKFEWHGRGIPGLADQFV